MNVSETHTASIIRAMRELHAANSTATQKAAFFTEELFMKRHIDSTK
jgi:hypothetical protein